SILYTWFWAPGYGRLDGPLRGKFSDSARARGVSPHGGNRRNRRVFEEIHHAPLALRPYPVHAARAEEEAVGMLAHPHSERDRSLHRLDDVPEGQLVGRSTKHVTAVGTAARPHEPLVDQLLDDLLEKLPRNALARCDLTDRAGAIVGFVVGEMKYGAS